MVSTTIVHEAFIYTKEKFLRVIGQMLCRANLGRQHFVVAHRVECAPFSCIDRLVLLHLSFLLDHWADHGLRVRMNEEGNRVTGWQDVACDFGAHHPVHGASAAIVGQSLKEVCNIDQHSARHRECRLEIASVERVHFESADRVLEQHGTEAEISVWDDSCVTFLFHDLSLNGGVVKQAQLRISTLGDVGEEVVTEFHGDSEALEHVHTQAVTLCVELIHGLLEAGQIDISWTGWVAEAAMLIAFLVVYATICFITITSIALVQFRILEPPGNLLLQGKLEKCF